MQQTAKSVRSGNLDFVRVVASVLVVWSHTMPKNGDFFKYVFDPGKLGVVTFFLISGHLVPWSAAKGGSAADYGVKRVFRLYPLYWMSIVLAFVVRPDAIKPLEWALNFSMVQQFLGADNAVNVYWTLTIEFAFYFLVGAGLYKYGSDVLEHAGRATLAAGFLALGASAVRFLGSGNIPVALPLGVFAMLVAAHQRGIESREYRIRVWGMYTLVVLGASLLAYSRPTEFDETPSRYMFSYLLAAVCFVIATTGPSLPANPVLEWCANLSYGIYLFHMVVVWVVEDELAKGWPMFFVVTSVSSVLAAIGYVTIERPLDRLGRRVVRRIR